MASKTISTILNLKDNFSKTINNATGSTKQFQRQIQHTQNQIQSMKTAINDSFKGLAIKAGGLVAGLGLASFAKDSIMLASDLQEVANVVDTTFGEASKSINEFSKNAIQQFGLNELQAKQFSGTLGAMFKSSGIAGDELTNMSTNLSGLAGDFASFYNLDPAEAFEKIKAGMVGSTEPLLALGINMQVANLKAYALSKGITKSWDSMSQGEQTQLRYQYLMEKSKDAQGDFAKTNTGFANQLRIAQTQIKQLGASIASYALPFLNKMLLKVNDFINIIPKGIDSIKYFLSRLKKGASEGDIFTVIMEHADDILFAVFPRKLANFISSTIGAILGFGIDLYNNIVRITKDLKQPFMDAFNAIKTFIGARLDEIQPLLDGFIKNSTPFVETAFNKIRDVLKEVFEIAAGIYNFFNDNWKTLEPIIAGVTAAVVAYNIAMKAAELWTNLVKVAQAAWAVVTGICNTIMMLLNGTLVISPFGWMIIAIGAVVAAGIALYQNWDTVKAKAAELWEGIKNAFSGVGDWFGGIWDGIKSGFSSLINFIIRGINLWLKYQLAPLNLLIDAANKIPGIDIKNVEFKIPEIPKFALGTQYFKGGLAQINERGGEIVNLPGGSQVIPADKSSKDLNNSKPNIVININGIGKSTNEILNEFIPALKLAILNS